MSSSDICADSNSSGYDDAVYENVVDSYIAGETTQPLLLCGDALETLRSFPSNSIDCCITSPPYWSKREYSSGGIGQEMTYQEYVQSILRITDEIHRVLKDSGSFWLNIGDSYKDKVLLNIPWRVSIEMAEKQGWILRNTVIWNKVKGSPDNSKDKLRNMYEPVFHFVKSKRYYYDVDSIRNPPKNTIERDGCTVSATGVSGKRYRKQIVESVELTDAEKQDALEALDGVLNEMNNGNLSDFRIVIRGQQRTTHSDSERMSGRARELHSKGYYFLKYNPKGAKPGDIWNIIPEDTQKRDRAHFAPYPVELCDTPLKTTCPKGGVVLDPFCGTGTTLLAARCRGLKSIGIDISREYIDLTQRRLNHE